MTTQAQIYDQINDTICSQQERACMEYFERHVWGNDGLPMTAVAVNGGADLKMTVVGADFTVTTVIGPDSGHHGGTTSQAQLDREIGASSSGQQATAASQIAGDVWGDHLFPAHAFSTNGVEHVNVFGPHFEASISIAPNSHSN